MNRILLIVCGIFIVLFSLSLWAYLDLLADKQAGDGLTAEQTETVQKMTEIRYVPVHESRKPPKEIRVNYFGDKPRSAEAEAAVSGGFEFEGEENWFDDLDIEPPRFGNEAFEEDCPQWVLRPNDLSVNCDTTLISEQGLTFARTVATAKARTPHGVVERSESTTNEAWKRRPPATWALELGALIESTGNTILSVDYQRQSRLTYKVQYDLTDDQVSAGVAFRFGRK